MILFFGAAALISVTIAVVYYYFANPKQPEPTKRPTPKHPTWNLDTACDQLVAVVNPYSGTKSGRAIWQAAKQVILDEHPNLDVVTIVSEYAGHEREIADTLIRSDKRLVLVIVGGDGFIYEVINGLINAASTQDADSRLVNFPICVLPGGSGNGVAASFGFFDGATAAKHVLHQPPQRANLMRLKCSMADGDEDRVVTKHAALSIGIGGVADHDYYSENSLRWLPLRTTLVPIFMIGCNASYHTKLSFLPVDASDADMLAKSDPGEQGWRVIEDDFFLLHIVNQKRVAYDCISAPKCRPGDDSMHIVVIRKCSRFTALSVFMAMESGDHVNNPAVEIYPVTAFKMETNGTNFAVDGQCFHSSRVEGKVVRDALDMFFEEED